MVGGTTEQSAFPTQFVKIGSFHLERVQGLGPYPAATGPSGKRCYCRESMEVARIDI